MNFCFNSSKPATVPDSSSFKTSLPLILPIASSNTKIPSASRAKPIVVLSVSCSWFARSSLPCMVAIWSFSYCSKALPLLPYISVVCARDFSRSKAFCLLSTNFSEFIADAAAFIAEKAEETCSTTPT